jgi:hypothetical protein
MDRQFITQKRWRKGLAVVGLAWLAVAAQGASVRVTTWDLGPRPGAAARSEADRIQEAASALKALNPDVILLQDVANRESCMELAKALKPGDYTVAACSSFRDAATGQPGRHQAAILARAQAYISWSELWKSQGANAAPAGGFAFAAIRLGDRNVGIFSVQAGPAGGAVGMQQLLEQIATVRKWNANAVQSVVAAGDLGADPKDAEILSEGGLADALLNVPPGKKMARAKTGAMFIEDAGLAADPGFRAAAFAGHYSLTCDLDLNAPTPVPMLGSLASEAASTDKTEAAQPAAATGLTASEKLYAWWLAGLAAGTVLLVLATWRLARRPPVKRRAAGTLAAGTTYSASERIVILPRATTTGSLASPGAPAHSPPVVQIEVPGFEPAPAGTKQGCAANGATTHAEEARVALREGLMAHLSRWLKEKLIQKLVTDRAQLMQAQQVAALKALAVDERLARVESQIQERMRVYEQRIEELLKELAVAKEENRELIRAKIAQVRAEMERERAKAAQR